MIFQRIVTSIVKPIKNRSFLNSVRCLSEINLSPSEAGITDGEDFKERNRAPAKYPFRKLDSNPTILSQLMLKVKSKKMREKHDLILLEGRRLIQEAVDAGCQVHSLFFSRIDDLNLLDIPGEEIQIFKAPYNDLKNWSELTTSPGLIAICHKPSPVPETRDSLPLTIICDQLREPGNLGSMIRNCAGAGVRRVILTPGCTDLWDGKVLRGGAGAHFKVRIRPDVSWKEIAELVEKEDAPLHVAVTQATSEGSSTMERILPMSPYWTVDFRSRHNFIVVGGETEGVSRTAFEVAANTNGSRLTIPLANGVDSLNSVSAASVIMFEIRKQFLRSDRVDHSDLAQ